MPNKGRTLHAAYRKKYGRQYRAEQARRGRLGGEVTGTRYIIEYWDYLDALGEQRRQYEANKRRTAVVS